MSTPRVRPPSSCGAERPPSTRHHAAAGQDGTVWIKREETLADSVRWQVLGPDGALEGELHLPQGQTVLTAEGNIMVAVELDDLDVPYIVVPDRAIMRRGH